jgi:hypothetical protein
LLSSLAMQKKPQHISYELAKVSFGIYLVGELREAGGKEFPTETDVKKTLLRINPSCTTADLQTARQVSRYCQTSKDYLRDAREETLDKVAKALNTPIKNFTAFREKVNPLLKAFKYYSSYIEQAEAYLKTLDNEGAGDTKKKFCGLFACNEQTKTYYSMISYHFGEVNKELPAVSFGAESDMRTERILSELFDVFDLPSPQYLPETIFFEQLDKQATKTNFIAIGLFGNRLTEWMSANNCLVPTLEILPAEKCIKLKGKTYYAARDEGIDHALFCRVTLNPNTTVFIIGGIEGFGTQRMGEYLEDNWPAVYGLTAGHDKVVLLFETANDVKLVEKMSAE